MQVPLAETETVILSLVRAWEQLNNVSGFGPVAVLDVLCHSLDGSNPLRTLSTVFPQVPQSFRDDGPMADIGSKYCISQGPRDC